MLGCITYSELEYDRKSVTYQYPQWAIGVGWSLASISVICIPIVFAYRIWNAEGTFKEVCNLYDLSLVVGKSVFGVSDQIPQKPGCTATEDGCRLEISDLGRRGFVQSV